MVAGTLTKSLCTFSPNRPWNNYFHLRLCLGFQDDIVYFFFCCSRQRLAVPLQHLITCNQDGRHKRWQSAIQLLIDPIASHFPCLATYFSVFIWFLSLPSWTTDFAFIFIDLSEQILASNPFSVFAALGPVMYFMPNKDKSWSQMGTLQEESGLLTFWAWTLVYPFNNIQCKNFLSNDKSDFQPNWIVLTKAPNQCRWTPTKTRTCSQVSHNICQTSFLDFGDKGPESPRLRHLPSNHLRTETTQGSEDRHSSLSWFCFILQVQLAQANFFRLPVYLQPKEGAGLARHGRLLAQRDASDQVVALFGWLPCHRMLRYGGMCEGCKLCTQSVDMILMLQLQRNLHATLWDLRRDSPSHLQADRETDANKCHDQRT